MRFTIVIVFLVFMIAISGLMTGCATYTPERFPFYVPPSEPWKDMQVQYIKGPDGTSLAYRQAGDLSTDKVMILVPGSTMYGYYYVPYMEKLSGFGITVRTIDLRGHGNSGGPRGDVPDEDALIDDLHRHIVTVRNVNPRLKIFLAGHSLGAGVCGKYLEKYGYDSVTGAVYFAPFFHWRQPGMKPASYVEVDYLKIIFGGAHTVTQVYHPASDDHKLVRKYTKIMGQASMLSSYGSFRSKHTTPSLYLIGKKDELFDWKTSPDIFKDTSRMKTIVYEDAAHLDILEKGLADTVSWLEQFR